VLFNSSTPDDIFNCFSYPLAKGILDFAVYIFSVLALELNLKNIVLSSVSNYLTKSIFYHIFAGYENFDISHF